MAVPAPKQLTVETLERPLAVATAQPRFGWWIDASGPGANQTSYEIEILDPVDRSVVAASGRVRSDKCAFVKIAGVSLPARRSFIWRVRVWLAGTQASDWAESSFGTGFLDFDDWSAPWIEPQQLPVTHEAEVDAAASATGAYPHIPVDERLHPCPMVRQTFFLKTPPRQARLYITAHGLFDILLNGRAVTDEIFAPGYDAHPQRLSVHTYDLTHFLQAGENVIGITLADGWWAGRTSFSGASANYGDRLGVTWQLEADREIIAVSDGTALSAFGPIRYADIFIGEKYDARQVVPGWTSTGFSAASWSMVNVVGRNVEGLTPFIGEPVRRKGEIKPIAILTTPAGDTIVDLGQNIAGRLRLRARGSAGDTIRIEHSESLDRDGNFINNIMGRNKDQTDVWILSGRGEENFEPTFTFHGFRYARVTGYPGVITRDDATGIVISSDLAETGAFETDNARVTRLHQNVLWSQRANFFSIPTDCPQRERAGWTGDIQVFAPAATNNMNVHQFLTRWLANVRAAQQPNGQIPMIVPNTPSFVRMMPFATESAAGWGDAIALVPFALYDRCGDTQVIEDNYSAMRGWQAYVQLAAETGVPERYKDLPAADPVRARQRYLWNTGFQFGDWMAPSTITEDPSSVWNAPKLTGELVGSAFYYRTTGAVLRAARMLGDVETANRLEQLAPRIKAAFVEEFVGPDGRISVDLQGAYVLALAFDLVPYELRRLCADNLFAKVEAADFHLDAGFLSLPLLLDVLVEFGRADLAYKILLQVTAPSWLYEVDHGATTIWESWKAVAPDGQPGNLSLNHYAFGAVDDWLFRHVAGVKALSPGYKTLLIEPDLHAPFQLVRAKIATPQGEVEIELDRRQGANALTILIPANVSAELRLDGQPQRALAAGRHELNTPGGPSA